MVLRVRGARVRRRASFWIRRIDIEVMFIDMVAVNVVQVAVVEVVDVPGMPHCGVFAIAVHVSVRGMRDVVGHGRFLSWVAPKCARALAISSAM